MARPKNAPVLILLAVAAFAACGAAAWLAWNAEAPAAAERPLDEPGGAG